MCLASLVEPSARDRERRGVPRPAERPVDEHRSLVRARSERSRRPRRPATGRPAAGRRRRWRRSRRSARSGRSRSPAAASVKPIPIVSSRPSPFGVRFAVVSVSAVRVRSIANGADRRADRPRGDRERVEAVAETRAGCTGTTEAVRPGPARRRAWRPRRRVASDTVAVTAAFAPSVYETVSASSTPSPSGEITLGETASPESRVGAGGGGGTGGGGADPIVPLAGRVSGPASIVQVYEACAAAGRGPRPRDRRAGAVAASRRPSRPRCAPSPPTAAGAERRAVKTTGPPSEPLTVGA